jgi:hypothetical protein
MNARLHHLSPSDHAVAIVLGILASVATLGPVLVLFDSASETPWLPAGQAALVAHCDSRHSTSQRKACVREAMARHQAATLASR